jgi:hypothetical protein
VTLGVTQTRCLDPYEDLIRGRLGDLAVLDLDGLSELGDDGGFHSTPVEGWLDPHGLVVVVARTLRAYLIEWRRTSSGE